MADQSNDRIVWADISRGIGILCVIYGHLSSFDSPVRVFVYSFHMPLFFILSGFFYKKRSVKDEIKNDFFKLILPAYEILLLDIIISLGMNLIQKEPFPSINQWLDTFVFYGGLWRNYPVWFLLSLTGCRVICLFRKKAFYMIFFIVSVIVCCTLNDLLPVWWCTTIISAFPFFIIGQSIKNIYQKLPKRITSNWNLYLLAIGGVILTSLISHINGPTDMYQNIFGKSYLLFFISGLTGSVVTVTVSVLLMNHQFCGLTKFFRILGKHSLLIMLSHYYICRMIIPKIAKRVPLFGNALKDVIWQLLFTLVIALVYYFLLRLKEKRIRI